MNKKIHIRRKWIPLLLLLLLAMLNEGAAQDIHFSQFSTTPLVINPAHTGNFSGNFRVSNNFRSQWMTFAGGTGYKTLSLSYDQPIRSLKRDISLGGTIIYDRSGSLNLTVSKILISGAYKRKRAKNTYLVGVQGGIALSQFDEGQALYGSQFNNTTGYLDPTIPSGELTIAENTNNVSLNAGAIWKRDFNLFRSELGMAIFNLNYPKEKTTGSDQRKRPKMLYHGSLKFYVSHRFHITPQFVYQQLSGAENLLAGSEFLLMPATQSGSFEGVFMGGYVRTGFNRVTDALILTAGVKTFRMRIGLSYDLNISDLQESTQTVGGFELSFVYQGISTVFDPGALPCTRQ